MMDISVSGGASGAEAAAAAKGGRQAVKGNDASGGGFSDVLDKTNGGGAGGKNANASANGQADGVAENVQPDAQHVSHKPVAKPVIDLNDSSLKAQAEAGANAGKAAEKAPADHVKAKPGKSSKTNDADEIGDELAAHVAKGGKPGKNGPSDADDAAASDDDAASDVLSLLVQTPVDGSAGAAMAAAMNGQKFDGKATSDIKEKAPADAKTKDQLVSDVASSLSTADASGDEVSTPGTEETDSISGSIFRLSRADGRGQSMDVHLGIDRDAAQESGGRANVENVSILDSRRYIGLAGGTNSAAVTAAISGDAEWAHALQASSALSNAAEWTSTGKVVNTLKIQMNPIELGLVTATMRLQGDALNIDLKVETGAAYRQLKEDHSKIVEVLRAQGYAIDNVSISMALVDRSDTGNQAGGQGQSAQQQAFAQQGQGGQARERQYQSGQSTGGGFDGAGETGMDGVAAGTAGGRGTGDVYL
ncbi:flagellar hook-length control protein FliK [Rhizobium sp. S152]|uniref:flagellar hook-length control protein FliK n=1 Tax=Rhizobium sp. S152 TaxID=3055038 RepID=UPI0025A95B83|nr:flagellar hook-length control protein FliK [Rhizobium sp. S152]MDM9626409.1 flagellar hook-length control protein FliK [Rhizobium sp. S152]